MSGWHVNTADAIAIDRHLDERERQETEFYATHTACAYPACECWPSIAQAFRVNDEDGTRFYCGPLCWESHVTGIGLPDNGDC